MKIEQLELKLGCRKYLTLDSPMCADEERVNRWIGALQSSGDCETGIEMSAGASSGEENAHPYARSIANDGSVARPPITFSRVLPMFTRMPVINIDSTRFDLP